MEKKTGGSLSLSLPLTLYISLSVFYSFILSHSSSHLSFILSSSHLSFVVSLALTYLLLSLLLSCIFNSLSLSLYGTFGEEVGVFDQMSSFGCGLALLYLFCFPIGWIGAQQLASEMQMYTAKEEMRQKGQASKCGSGKPVLGKVPESSDIYQCWKQRMLT